MSLYEALRTAHLSLLANKSRSVLTMLGVIIGVAAVVMVVAIGEGMRDDITSRIQSMGSNLIMVMPGGGRRGPGGTGQTQPGRLDERDLEESRRT
jgi:putative ABC transport system permease protein